MDKILVDTNIVLDLLAKRQDFYEGASRLFSLGDKQKVKLYVSALTFANTHYILSKHTSDGETRKVLGNLKVLVNVLSMDDKIIELSLNSDFKDFEDAIQYFTALENNLNIIITRNLKDFKTAKLPVMRAEDYLANIKE